MALFLLGIPLAAAIPLDRRPAVPLRPVGISLAGGINPKRKSFKRRMTFSRCQNRSQPFG